MNESIETIAERFYTLLLFQLKSHMPRPGTIHEYSKGALINSMLSFSTSDGYEIVISPGVKYAEYALGFKDDGSLRSPRGKLEKINFETVKQCAKSAADSIAASTGGKVTITW